MAHLALAEAAAETTPEAVRSEFFELFIGVGRGELLPYASFYLTGFLHERPLALVREDMGKLRHRPRRTRRRARGPTIAILMDAMANLIRGTFAAEGVAEHAFFSPAYPPQASRLFADLEIAKAAKFYKAVGRVGSLFLEIETQAAGLPSSTTRVSGAMETTMSNKPESTEKPAVDRRSFFKALGAGAAVAATPAMVTPAEAVDPGKDETRARYRETDHIKAYYRVNRYSRGSAMLIKRKSADVQRGKLQAAMAGLSSGVMDRRTFLRRSGLLAGGVAAAGALQIGSVRKAEAAELGPASGAKVVNEHLHALLGRLHGQGRGRQRRLGRPGAGLGEPDQARQPLRQGRLGARARPWRPPHQVPDEARRRAMAAACPGTRRSARSATR